MSGGIYLIQGNDQLVEMVEKPYDSETLLQELLEKYPNILAVNTLNQDRSKRWLVVHRTVGITSEEIMTEEWSLNRLFLDQQAIPTFVEVKRNRELRDRREMIGQMLEYAANATSYWPIESILSQFETNCREQNRDPETVFGEFLGQKGDEESFWQQVKTNLQAGRVRLIFVSDQISPGLQRLVEFLNEQMDPAEVLAVEIKQYTDQEQTLKTLVCKVIGQTAEAQQKKTRTSRERRQWDQDSFFKEYQIRYGQEETDLVKKIYQWAIAQKPKLDVQWSTGDVYGGFSVQLKLANSEQVEELFFLGIDGSLQIASNHYAMLSPFTAPENWSELRNKLSSIGLALPIDPTERRLPNFQLSSLLSEETALEKVLTTFDWVIVQLGKNYQD